jgi:hypothetical protein
VKVQAGEAQWVEASVSLTTVSKKAVEHNFATSRSVRVDPQCQQR